MDNLRKDLDTLMAALNKRAVKTENRLQKLEYLGS